MNLIVALITVSSVLLTPYIVACAMTDGCPDISDEECEMICVMNDVKPLPDNYEEDLFQCYQQTKDIRCLKK